MTYKQHLMRSASYLPGMAYAAWQRFALPPVVMSKKAERSLEAVAARCNWYHEARA